MTKDIIPLHYFIVLIDMFLFDVIEINKYI
jgi:hypothetical protein